jgi:CHAT domain-containing protein
VVLSACESAVSDPARLPDELIALSAGFLQAGVPGVIATLWEVADLSTALLMGKFYALLRGTPKEPGLPPADALRQGQRWLRDVRADELEARFAAELGRPEPERRWPEDQADDAWRKFARMARDAQPYVEPFYWAAFLFSGDST